MTPLPIALQRRAALTLGVVGLAALILAVTVWAAGTPTGSNVAARPSPTTPLATPSDGAVTSDAPSVDAPESGWGELALPPFPVAAATLIATKTDRDQVATNTAFTLTSLGRWSAVDLARAIVVEPSIDLNVKAGADDQTATIEPADALEPGRLYRFTVRTADGAPAGSWAFQTAAPLNVVTTLPGDQATKVPVNTGIEVTFDQDGVLDVAPYFSIQPAVKGTFEQHGRTVVFVSEDQLEPGTVYAVTLKRGVSLGGSDQVLEKDLQFRFETAPIPPPTGASPEPPYVWFGFPRSMIEVRPNERPILAVSISASSPALQRAPFPVDVYRLSSEAVGIDAVQRLRVAPYWATASRAGLMSIDGLTRVVEFNADTTSINDWGGFSIRFPTLLEPGWYLVEIPRPDRPAQTVLQVTDIAAYSAVARDRLVVWASDIATGAPLVGASVAVIGGDSLGVTGADGLLIAKTPASILAVAGGSTEAKAQQLAIRTDDGRSLVVPVGLAGNGGAYLADGGGYGDYGGGYGDYGGGYGDYGGGYGGDYQDVTTDYWRLLATDRGIYRRTDTINVWGYLRSRDGARPPTDLALTLTGNYASTEIASVPVKVDRSGAFVASLAIDDLPYGGYTVELMAGDLYLGSVWVSVEEIRKPSYSLSLTTDRHVLVAGDPVTVTSRATFFDGTPVPGVDLDLNVFGAPRESTTDRAGTVTIATAAGNYGYISVQPARSEESEIRASTYIRVFPSSVRIDATATIDGGRIDLKGTLNQVAIRRLEAAWPDTWSVDAKGSPVRGGTISVEVIEQVAVRTRTYSVYDFISKQVFYAYDYRWDEVSRFSRSLTSGEDGSFGLQFAADPKHDYEITVEARDDAGRWFNEEVWVQGPERPHERTTSGSLVPYLASQDCRPQDASEYRVGDPICLQMRNDAGPLPTGGGNRYLFFAAQRGLRQVAVQDSSLYSSTFTSDYVPNAFFWGVRFTGTTFTPVEYPYWVRFDSEQRRLAVNITSDRKRYAPGDTVTLGVRTTDIAGSPVSAAVVLRAIDEKLYAIGGAYDPDPLRDLYSVGVESRLLWTHASHPLPFARGPRGGGDTSGGDGDGRSDFADSVLFRKVTTDGTGRARISFKLSDDLTSWHVSASATTGVPEAGAGSILIPVGLPFFVEATLAPEYLAGERPTLRLRAYGSDLRQGDRVTYTVTSKSLGMPATTVRGSAFDDVEVPLPALSVGERAVTISASVRRAGATLSDRLTRRFVVVDSRLTRTRTTYAALTSGLRPEGGVGWTTYVFSDAGRGRYLSLLHSLSWARGARVDQALAATIARDLLVEEFGVDPDWLPKATFDAARYQRSDGVALLPYASPDLGLTARIALLAGDRFNRDSLVYWLQQVRDDPTSTRERRIVALAGLAGLGEPVLPDLRQAAADPGLTIRERLYVALGAATLGDDATAGAIERDLLGKYGQRRGASIRLRVGESLDDTIEATSLVSLVAAQLGEPFAPELEAYVDANPAADDLYNLQQVAFVTRMLDRTPSTAARFAYTMNGQRTVVDLEPGQSYSLVLLGAQRRGLAFEPLTGSVSVSTTWQVARDVSTIEPDPEVAITRTVLPAGDIPSTTFVEVRLTATFGPQVVTGCYVVTDLVPSGLAPVTRLQIPAGEDPAGDPGRFVTPWEIEAQRVSFCVGREKSKRSVEMRYFARIVSPGEYLWEPAVIQSTAAAESINFTSVRRITIR